MREEMVSGAARYFMKRINPLKSNNLDAVCVI